jgi:hypothetical protein
MERAHIDLRFVEVVFVQVHESEPKCVGSRVVYETFGDDHLDRVPNKTVQDHAKGHRIQTYPDTGLQSRKESCDPKWRIISQISAPPPQPIEKERLKTSRL